MHGLGLREEGVGLRAVDVYGFGVSFLGFCASAVIQGFECSVDSGL